MVSLTHTSAIAMLVFNTQQFTTRMIGLLSWSINENNHKSAIYLDLEGPVINPITAEYLGFNDLKHSDNSITMWVYSVLYVNGSGGIAKIYIFYK